MMDTTTHPPSSRTGLTATASRTSQRARIAQRILRLRHDVRRYRRWALGLATLAVVSLIFAAVMWGADPATEVELGKGVAGVETPVPTDPASERTVALPAVAHEPKPVTGEPLVRKVLGEGAASYYHDALEGHPTASGQPYHKAA